MEFDFLDFFIINEIYKKKKVSTWDMTKSYFKKNNMKKEGKYNMDKFHLNLRNRFKKMELAGIVIVTKELNDCGYLNKNHYNLIKENIIIGKHKFGNKYYETICLKVQGKWIGYQI